MLQRLSGPLDALLACGVARRVHDDLIELYVTADEATQGGMITIAMRVAVRCKSCGGKRWRACERCDGKGSRDELFSAWLALRPGTADGATLQPSVLLPDMLRPVSFRVCLVG